MARGYSDRIIESALFRAKSIPRKTALLRVIKNKSNDRPLALTCTCMQTCINVCTCMNIYVGTWAVVGAFFHMCFYMSACAMQVCAQICVLVLVYCYDHLPAMILWRIPCLWDVLIICMLILMISILGLKPQVWYIFLIVMIREIHMSFEKILSSN